MKALLEIIQSRLLNLIGIAIDRLPGFLTAFIIILLTRYAVEFVEQVTRKIGKRTIRSASLQILFIKTSCVSTWVVGTLVASVIAFPSLRLGDIIAALGLGSVAIGFAFQDIFKNFLAGVLLLLQEPFRINDQVIIADYEGTVEEINIRCTAIRTYAGERVLLPNSTVFTSPVQVRTASNCRRTDLEVGVDYKTSLSETIEILLEALKGVNGVLDNPIPEVDLVRFGDSSIDLMVRYWTLPEQKEVRRTKTQVVMAIKEACDRANIDIAYPTRVLLLQKHQEDEANAAPED